MTQFALETCAKVACIGFLIFQGALLDAYMVTLRSKLWALWCIADIFVICIWVATLVAAAKKFRLRELMAHDGTDGRDPSEYPDEIRYAYVAWISYAACLVPRIVILFRKHAPELDERNFLGPNFLKVAVSCTPIIFLLLVYGHHDAKPRSERKHYIEKLAGSVALDLFDSIDLLEFMFEPESQEKIPRGYLDATLAFGCINFFLPFLALVELKFNKFDGRVSSLPFKIVYISCFIFFVNMPNLIIRSILWHRYNANVSVLIMKNVMCILLGVIELWEYLGGHRHLQCGSCKAWLEKSFLVECPLICGNCKAWLEKSFLVEHTEACDFPATERAHSNL